MSGPENRHEAWEVLVSASLHGDLSPDERRRLDAHLDGCEHCRAVLAEFADTRRIVAGLRHVAPPRDLGARVRAGIEWAEVPWWRKPALLFTAVGGSMAVVAGALLALVLLNGNPSGPQVGQLSPTPNPTTTPAPSRSAEPGVTPPAATLPPAETPAPGETPGPEATPDPNATENPIAAASPEPDLYVAMTGPADNQAITVVEQETEEPIASPETAALGPPVAAELSGDGGWLAVIAEDGLSGANVLSVTRVAEAIQPDDPEATPIPEPSTAIGESIPLGRSVGGSPFLERMAWAPDGSFLAYTISDPDGGGTDVWLFERDTAAVRQLTDVGDAHAASWAVLDSEDGGDGSLGLWVSRAEGTVTSYLVSVTNGAGAPAELIDPSTDPIAVAEHVFQPVVSPNGGLSIYWDGRMERSGEAWLFVEGGAPWLSEHRPDGSADRPFPNERPLFSDITIDRDAFSSAAIAWSLDSNTYAVWSTAWTGASQSTDPAQPYPDPARVYFGHADDPRGLTQVHAIDRADFPADWNVVDVKVPPTGHHLVITVAEPRAGQAIPTAQLILVRRNTGNVADEVEVIRSEPGEWFGPAAFDDYVVIEGEQTEAP